MVDQFSQRRWNGGNWVQSGDAGNECEAAVHTSPLPAHMHTFMDPLLPWPLPDLHFLFFHCTHHSNTWLPHQHTFTLLLSVCASSVSVSAAAVSHVLACVDPFCYITSVTHTDVMRCSREGN